MSETNPAQHLPDDEIDLRGLFLTLWERRLLIGGSSAAGLAVAAVYAFAIAKPVFESSALLLPTQTQSVDQLGAAAALLGKKSSSNADVELYQSLLTSRTVLHKLLHAPMKNLSDTGKGKVEPLMKILSVDTAKPGMLSGMTKAMSQSVSVESKQTGAGGILEIKFAAGTPWLAQQIGNTLLEIGQEELRLVRIRRSDVILSRLTLAVDQASDEWNAATEAVRLFKNANLAISVNQQPSLSRLEMEQSAKEQKYLLARKEYETLMLEREKAAPPMMVLDAADLPDRKSKPKRSLILALGLMVGLLGSSVCVLGWRTFVSISPKS